MTMRAVIVDDEELARRGIRALLKRAGDVEIVSECSSGAEAIRAISASDPELVYLDIQMHGKTGFDVIAALPKTKCPHVIFVTAFDRFAVRAFEIHALDYLLKPVNEQRFAGARPRRHSGRARRINDPTLLGDGHGVTRVFGSGVVATDDGSNSGKGAWSRHDRESRRDRLG